MIDKNTYDMEITIKQAFSEVYDIVSHLEKELYKKIPKKIIDMIKKNRDLNYKFYIDYKDIGNQELLKETRAILSIIYRDYLCSPEEKIKLIENDKKELIENQEEFKQIYSIENIFRNKKEEFIQDKNIMQSENTKMIKYKISFFDRIIKKIKSIFKIR